MDIPSDGNSFICDVCSDTQNEDDADEDLNASEAEIHCKRYIIKFDTYDDRDEHMKENPAYCSEHDICFPKNEEREHANRHPNVRCFLMNCVCEYDGEDVDCDTDFI